MYIVFAEELDDLADVKAHTIPNPGRRLCPDRLPLRPSYRFEPQNEGGWAMILTDVERPEQRKLSALRRGGHGHRSLGSFSGNHRDRHCRYRFGLGDAQNRCARRLRHWTQSPVLF